MGKYTPGPWVWDGHWLNSKTSGSILWYTTDDNGVHAKPDDAKLIAASPDLLEACKMLLASHDASCTGEDCQLAGVDLARAAIRKATE